MNTNKTLLVLTGCFLAPATMAFGNTMHYDSGASYSDVSDSPFSSALTAESVSFWLEDFEDGVLDTPGVTASNGVVRAPGGSTDSVDGDDGVLDGTGNGGHSFWHPDFQNGSDMVFTFDANELGQLPTFAGLVWTDGTPDAMVTFTAFDAEGAEIDSMQLYLGDGIYNGTTAADRFLGVEFANGISAISITSSFDPVEIDHLQYGFASAVVPVPPALGLGLAGLGLLAARRRRQQRA